jgi:diguanylate cyclase (GGDEF)-like protein/putative nucleotidyltransferase with HDIG domain
MQQRAERSAVVWLFCGAVIALGVSVLITGLTEWESKDPTRGYLYIVLAILASTVRLNLPHLVGSMSITFLFTLIGVLQLSLSETLLMGSAATAVQMFVNRAGSRIPAPPLFQIANPAIAVALTWRVYHSHWMKSQDLPQFVELLVVVTLLYAMNTFPLAAWMALTRRAGLAQAWRESNSWSFPYYIAGACLAALFHFSSQILGGHSPVMLLPIGFLIYFASQNYLHRLTQQKAHVEDMASLHLRTIEALALAIEAKDQTGHTHLERMRTYSLGMGKRLGLPPEDLEALGAAAVLHDVGKLAVPEHILSKPGPLTREEFEKIKIHPIVGAEILERVNFPYPVARLVRFHHEKWNGTGYPAGLKGDQIPMGARILAVADCFDALISGRPYRQAVSFEEALRKVRAEAGASFDPAVVQVLLDHYHEWEAEMRGGVIEDASADETVPGLANLSAAASGTMPPVFFDPQGPRPAFFDSIRAARKEAQLLLELTLELGNSLQLDDSLLKLATGLKRMISFDTMVIYVVREDTLAPRYALGDCASILLSREIASGQGLPGWVAKFDKPVLNGNPSFEVTVSERTRLLPLEAAVAVPLHGVSGLAGVLMLANRRADTFNKDHLRVLLSIAPKLGVVVENSLMFEQATASASTDFLTGLPNSRALFLQLENEIARARRIDGPLAVLVTDLDGFKAVNDRFGHLEGNSVLKAVSKALRAGCREYDYVARMGGDEFVMLLPGAKKEELDHKIKLLDRAVSEAARAVCAEADIALSVGTAYYPADGRTGEQLLAEADNRMYQIKQHRKKLRSERSLRRGYDFDWSPTALQ